MNPITVIDFITEIFDLLNIVNQGQTPNASEVDFVFKMLNNRLNQWNSISTFIFAVQVLNLTITAGKQIYFIGQGGADLNTARPFVRHASVDIVGQQVARPLELIGSAEWNAIQEPAQPGYAPWKLFLDYGYPIMTARIWPVPSQNSIIRMQAWVPLTEFASLTDVIDFPFGYRLPLLHQVAMDIIPGFAREIDPATQASIFQAAATAESQLQQLNAQLLRGIAAGPVPEMPPTPPGTIPATPSQPVAA